MNTPRSAILLFACATACAQPRTEEPPVSTVPADAGAVPDAAMPGAPDASLPDASLPDAAMPDASTPDAAVSVPDAGRPDAAMTVRDAGVMPNNVFNHEFEQPDPFVLLKALEDQGPPEVASRLHGCQKIKVETLGTLLDSLGVDLGRTSTPPSAGELFESGKGALGAPNYAARIPESSVLSSAGATRLFDIFMRAAPEIIDAMPMLARCNALGEATVMFDAQDGCTLEGITCLTGVRATLSERTLCSQAVQDATSVERRRESLPMATMDLARSARDPFYRKLNDEPVAVEFDP